jgi:hypothetical protein
VELPVRLAFTPVRALDNGAEVLTYAELADASLYETARLVSGEADVAAVIVAPDNLEPPDHDAHRGPRRAP